MVEQAADLGTSVDIVGYSIAAYALGVVVGSPLLSMLLARWDRKRILVLGVVMVLVSALATAIVPNPATLIAVRFFAGFPHGMYLGAGSVVGAHVAGAARRGRAMAMMMVGFTVAIIVGVPAMKGVAAAIGWRVSFLGVAAAALLALAAILFLVPSVAAPAGSEKSRLEDLAHLKGPRVWSAIAFAAIGFAGFGAVFAYMVPIMQVEDGLSVGVVTLMLSGVGLAATIGTVIAGRITDSSPVRSARLGILLTGVALVGIAVWGSHPAATLPLLLFIGGASALMSQGAQTHFMDVVHASPMLGASLSHAALNVANALGSALGAVVIGAGLGYLSPAWVGIALTLIGIGIVTWGPGFRTPKNQKERALRAVAR